MDKNGEFNSIRASVPFLLSWYEKNARDLPWRKNITPYRIWVSEIMLQQTRVETVIPYYERFLKRLPDLRTLAKADEETLLKLWEGLGYYSRVRNMQRAAIEICEKYGGEMPADYNSIRSLCGIGDYTAGAISSFAFGLPFPAVDGNVLRVLARLTADSGNILDVKTRSRLEAIAAELLPEEAPAEFNQAMIELGALVCKPHGLQGGPVCSECPFQSVCISKKAGMQDELPIRIPKTKHRIEERTVLKIWCGNRCLIQKRASYGLLASLYEFPNVLGHLTMEKAIAEVQKMGFEVIQIYPMKKATHVFSHLTWDMIGWSIRVAEPEGPLPSLFLTVEQQKKDYAIPTAFSAYAEQFSFDDGITV